MEFSARFEVAGLPPEFEFFSGVHSGLTESEYNALAMLRLKMPKGVSATTKAMAFLVGRVEAILSFQAKSLSAALKIAETIVLAANHRGPQARRTQRTMLFLNVTDEAASGFLQGPGEVKRTSRKRKLPISLFFPLTTSHCLLHTTVRGEKGQLFHNPSDSELSDLTFLPRLLSVQIPYLAMLDPEDRTPRNEKQWKDWFLNRGIDGPVLELTVAGTAFGILQAYAEHKDAVAWFRAHPQGQAWLLSNQFPGTVPREIPLKPGHVLWC